MNTSAPASAPFRSPLYLRRVGVLRDPAQLRRQAVALRVDDAADVGDDASLHAGREQQLEDRRAGRARTGHHDPDVADVLADHAQRVVQRRQHDDRRTVLVVVEDRDVELLAQPGLDLEAARRGDVLQVDAGEARARSPSRSTTISSGSWVSRHSGQASIPANRLNSAALPSITGSAAFGPMLPSPSTAEPSVTTATLLRLIVSRRASSGLSAIARQTRATPGRVDHRQVVTVADRVLGLHRDLAAEVHQEGPVGDLADLDARYGAHRLDQPVGVLGVARGAGHVDPQPLVAGRGHVERGDQTAGLLDRGRQLADRRAARGHLEANGDGVRNTRQGSHAGDPLMSLVMPGGSVSKVHGRPLGNPLLGRLLCRQGSRQRREPRVPTDQRRGRPGRGVDGDRVPGAEREVHGRPRPGRAGAAGGRRARVPAERPGAEPAPPGGRGRRADHLATWRTRSSPRSRAAWRTSRTRSGYSVVLCNSDENVEKENRYIDIAIQERVGGRDPVPQRSTATSVDWLISAVRRTSRWTGRCPEQDSDIVLVDTRLAARQATAHLIAQGYERVGCITGPAGVRTADDRLAGYRDALKAAQAPYVRNWSGGPSTRQPAHARRARPARPTRAAGRAPDREQRDGGRCAAGSARAGYAGGAGRRAGHVRRCAVGRARRPAADASSHNRPTRSARSPPACCSPASPTPARPPTATTLGARLIKRASSHR